MTNIIAAVIITISTNWTTIGTFTPYSSWRNETVEQGRSMTNTTAILEWKGQRREMVLESQEGPIIGERRVPVPTITNIVVGPTNWMRFQTNVIW